LVFFDSQQPFLRLLLIKSITLLKNVHLFFDICQYPPPCRMLHCNIRINVCSKHNTRTKKFLVFVKIQDTSDTWTFFIHLLENAAVILCCTAQMGSDTVSEVYQNLHFVQSCRKTYTTRDNQRVCRPQRNRPCGPVNWFTFS
jgi:hypothetical protein